MSLPSEVKLVSLMNTVDIYYSFSYVYELIIITPSSFSSITFIVNPEES